MICIRLFDCHSDTLLCGLKDETSIIAGVGAVDLMRGRRYTPWFQAFAAFVPDSLRGETARQRFSALLRVAEQWEQQNAMDFHIIRTRADLMDNQYVCHALLTGENIGAMETLDSLDLLCERYIHAATLTWNGDNAWGGGCLGNGSGLTALGRAALEIMQRNGVTVDVSHLSQQGFWDVARQSQCAFIASHSNAAGVYPHPRNLSDAQFCAVRDSGGVVGLNFYHPHLGEEHVPFLPLFRRHLEHFLSLDGEDTVCIGTDFDGMDCPSKWNGIAFVQTVYDYLLSCGYTAALLDKVFYTNAWRFFANAIV